MRDDERARALYDSLNAAHVEQNCWPSKVEEDIKSILAAFGAIREACAKVAECYMANDCEGLRRYGTADIAHAIRTAQPGKAQEGA
jgi:hypothetical protein